jgi:hypothetical protein
VTSVMSCVTVTKLAEVRVLWLGLGGVGVPCHMTCTSETLKRREGSLSRCQRV